MKISAIILADNREDIIESCLKSIQWADEIILVNLGSDDNTIKIAKEYQAKIIKGTGEYNFSRWRNQGAEKAKGDWLFYIDADERVSPELKKEIQQLAINNQQLTISGYNIPRKNYFLGKLFKTEWPDYQLRLIKKDCLHKWKGKLHETPDVKGETANLKNPLIHLSHRSLETSLENTLNWSFLEAENRLKSGHPKMTGWRFIRIVATGFWRQFFKRKVWREGTEGVIEGIYQVFSLFFSYYRLWEMQRKESLKESYKKIDKQI